LVEWTTSAGRSSKRTEVAQAARSCERIGFVSKGMRNTIALINLNSAGDKNARKLRSGWPD
jgi:hypothetical protein